MKKSTLLFALLALVLAACDKRADEKADTAADTAEKTAPAAEAPAVSAEELIWVFRARGDRQCEGGGTSLDESSAKLTNSGVAVQESHCGVRTDRMYPSVCGGATGNILLHLVSGESLDAALELGFDPAKQIQYQRGSCPDNGT